MSLRSKLTLFLLVCSCRAFAVPIVYHVENFGFFDNREVRSPYQHSQTMFGTRLGAELGVRRGPSRVYAGYAVVKEFGRKELANKEWTLYYHYREGGVSGAFGAFPRRLLLRELPEAFIDDSLRYYSPNLYGALIQHTGGNGFVELYCNWRGRQSYTQREIFDIVADGEYVIPYTRSAISTGFNAQLTHFSVRKGKTPDNVYDKIMLNPYTRFTLSGSFIDTYSFTTGALLSFNRDRTDNIWKTPAGFMGDASASKGWFTLANHLYVGSPQFSDYELYGAELHQGDAYYRSSFYDRVDASVSLLNRKNLHCSFTASFHFTEGVTDCSQMLYVHILF